VQFGDFVSRGKLLSLEWKKCPSALLFTWYGKKGTEGFLKIPALLWSLSFSVFRYYSTWYYTFINVISPFLIDWLLIVRVMLSFDLHWDGLLRLFFDAAPIKFLSCCFGVHGFLHSLLVPTLDIRCMIGCISTSLHGRVHDLLTRPKDWCLLPSAGVSK